LGTQPFAPAFQFVGAPELVHDPQVEQATGTGTPAVLVQQGSDPSLGVMIQKLIHFGNDLGFGFA
jgi:hypothetical protein